jgi:hypothetical protein
MRDRVIDKDSTVYARLTKPVPCLSQLSTGALAVTHGHQRPPVR